MGVDAMKNPELWGGEGGCEGGTVGEQIIIIY
jgi:hypothetical protein